MAAIRSVYSGVVTYAVSGVEAIPSRVFINGNSQAMHIPAEFRLNTDPAHISLTADGDLLFHPRPAQRGQALLQALAGYDDDFVASLEAQQAQQLPLQERQRL